MKPIDMGKMRIRILAVLGAGMLWLLSRTWKLRAVEFDGEKVRADGRPAIFVFWHNRQLMMPLVIELLKPPGLPVCTMISRHSDGRIVAGAVRLLGLESVAASSSRGGSVGLREMLRKLKAGQSLGITPDGPRGPLYKLKTGALSLGFHGKRPIFPVACSASRAWVFKSWDRMILPKPFATVYFRCGEEFVVNEMNEGSRAELERRLNEVTGAVDAMA